MSGHQKGSMSTPLHPAILPPIIRKRFAKIRSVPHLFWDVFLQAAGVNPKTSKALRYSRLPKLKIMCTELSLPWTAAGWGDKIISYSIYSNIGNAVNYYINKTDFLKLIS